MDVGTIPQEVETTCTITVETVGTVLTQTTTELKETTHSLTVRTGIQGTTTVTTMTPEED